MKHKIIHTTLFLLLLFNTQMFGQIPTPNNEVFVTNEVSINTDFLEFSPTFFEDGILFVSTKPVNKKYKVKDKRIDKNVMAIYQTTRDDDGKLQKPEPFAIELVTTVHEGPLTFDRTAENLFFTRNNYKGKKRIKGDDGIVKLQIYSSERMDNVWKNVEKLPFNEKNSNYAHPSIGVENNQLFFSSDRPGGEGGMDLYVSTKVGDEWGEPVNLGPNINTTEDEVFPFIHADGTLYFSSEAHSSNGKLDIFTTKQTDGQWMTPENMGVPFNSEQDDFGIIIDRDKRNGYFSSNRTGGIGQDDVYSFFALNGLEKNDVLPDFEKTITLNVLSEADDNLIPEAIVTYMKLDELALGKAITDISGSTGDNPSDLVLKLPIDENATTGLTDFNGQIPLNVNRGSYVVKVEKEGYIPKQLAIKTASDILEYTVVLEKDNGVIANNNGNGTSTGTGNGTTTETNGTGNDTGTSTSNIPNYDTPGYDPNNSTVLISTIEEGTIIELPNIYYNFNDASIRPDAQIDLDALAEFLLTYPRTEIELSSHTDSRGSDRYNNRLSQRRAEEAVQYLVSQGVDKYRMVPKGYGESKLRNECNDFSKCSEAEHQYNRRTEVKITKLDAPISVKFINNLPSYISEAPSRSKYKGRSKSSSSSSSSSSSEPSNIVNIKKTDDNEYNPDGDYKVIAGAFGNINNAEKRLVQIRELGYNNADILKFGSRGLFHVVVSRYSTRKEATMTVRKLKSQSMRAFIKN